MLIRLELLTPAGDLMTADMYNKAFTMHGQVMVFFFLIPSIPAVLGNFLVPMMIGAKDLALPRINLLSWYIYVVAGILYLHCIVTGGVDTGWTFYTPFSTAFSNTRVVEAGLAIFISGFSSILTGLNFVVTVHRMRAPGMTWSRLPLFVWSHYATSIIMLLGTPVIAITLILVVLERAVRDGGCPRIIEAPASAAADTGLVVGTGSGVRAADGLVVRERTCAQQKGSTGAI